MAQKSAEVEIRNAEFWHRQKPAMGATAHRRSRVQRSTQAHSAKPFFGFFLRYQVFAFRRRTLKYEVIVVYFSTRAVMAAES